MMNTLNDDDQVGHILEEAVTAFPCSAETKESVRRRVSAMAVETRLPPADEHLYIHHNDSRQPYSGVRRLAAAAAIGVVAISAVTIGLLWSAPLTLAQVQSAVQSVEWIHLKFDSGKEQWISPRRHVRAYVWSSGHLAFTDYSTGISLHYMPEGRAIDSFERGRDDGTPAKEQDSWDAVVGHLERAASNVKSIPEGRSTVERVRDWDGTRLLLRFDSFFIDALGERLLVEQLWADPQTGLPVRVRQRLLAHERVTDGQDFATGVYEFPATGPEDIFDLGAPRGLSIIHHDTSEADQVDPGVTALHRRVTDAQKRFLEHFRCVSWTLRDGDNVNVLYWSGQPQEQRTQDGTRLLDFAGVRIWQASYFDLDDKHPEHHLSATRDVKEVLRWTASQTPVGISLRDGDLNYSQNGPLPPMFTDADKVTLHVSKHRPMFSSNHWPQELYWPIVNNELRSNWTLLEASPEAPPGTIGVRCAVGDVLRCDYYFDPDHDYMCIKSTQWERRGELWTRDMQTELADLVQLPAGQWVAETVHEFRGGDPERNISESRYTYLFDVTPMETNGFPEDLFDGQALLERARETGAEITTY